MKISISIVPVLLSILFLQCKNSENIIPERDKDMSVATYDDFKAKLIDAYKTDSHIKIAYQLANLKASKKLVYEQLKKAVEKNVDNCEKIFDIAYLAREGGFFKSPYRSDTTLFNKVVDLCIEKIGPKAYEDFSDQVAKKSEEIKAKKANIDSSTLNHALIKILTDIQNKDQEIRSIIGDERKEMSEEKRNELWALQKQLDSINLIRVDSILTNHGYPSAQEVGHDLKNTIWFVVHHQVDVPTRNKYLEYMDGKLSEGQLDIFFQRTEHLKNQQTGN